MSLLFFFGFSETFICHANSYSVQLFICRFTKVQAFILLHILIKLYSHLHTEAMVQLVELKLHIHDEHTKKHACKTMAKATHCWSPMFTHYNTHYHTDEWHTLLKSNNILNKYRHIPINLQYSFNATIKYYTKLIHLSHLIMRVSQCIMMSFSQLSSMNSACADMRAHFCNSKLKTY
jgi:hypothetical protein